MLKLGERWAQRNINLDRWTIGDWADPNTQAKLIKLYGEAEKETLGAIDWYKRKKTSKACFSRFFRVVAICASVGGGMMPLLSGMPSVLNSLNVDQVFMSQLGYVLFALAAACLLFDKFFGTSSGWIRYIVTLMGIERTLIEFRAAYVLKLIELQGRTPTSDDLRAFHVLALDMRKNVQQQVQNETNAWAQEFQQSTAELEKLVSQQRQTAEQKLKELRAEIRTGAVNITVTSANKLDGPVEVFIDDKTDAAATLSGKTGSLKDLEPGQRKITIRSTSKGASVEASRTIMVEPGSIKDHAFDL